jgi:uncharacterized cupredoxin-like copper-binding protein
MPANSGTEDRSTFSLAAVLVAVASFLIATICVVVVSSSDSLSAGSSVTAAAPIAVTLSEFKITPSMIHAEAGDVTLSITNGGTAVHNVSVTPRAKTPDIPAGATVPLELGKLAAGTYEVQCLIPGHADSGMKATLMVAAAGSDSSSSSSGDMAGMDMSSSATPSADDYAAMDKKMADGMAAGLDTFTKGNATQGVGGHLLPDHRSRRDQACSISRRRSSTGRSARQDGEGLGLQRMVPGP